MEREKIIASFRKFCWKIFFYKTINKISKWKAEIMRAVDKHKGTFYFRPLKKYSAKLMGEWAKKGGMHRVANSALCSPLASMNFQQLLVCLPAWGEYYNGFLHSDEREETLKTNQFNISGKNFPKLPFKSTRRKKLVSKQNNEHQKYLLSVRSLLLPTSIMAISPARCRFT